jgi:hypothetical protein
MWTAHARIAQSAGRRIPSRGRVCVPGPLRVLSSWSASSGPIRESPCGDRVLMCGAVVQCGCRCLASRTGHPCPAHDNADGSPLPVVRSMFCERNLICRARLLEIVYAWAFALSSPLSQHGAADSAQSGLTAPYAARQGDVWRPALSVPDVTAPWSHLSITSSIRARPSFTGANTVARCGKSLGTPQGPRR